MKLTLVELDAFIIDLITDPCLKFTFQSCWTAARLVFHNTEISEIHLLTLATTPLCLAILGRNCALYFSIIFGMQKWYLLLSMLIRVCRWTCLPSESPLLHIVAPEGSSSFTQDRLYQRPDRLKIFLIILCIKC